MIQTNLIKNKRITYTALCLALGISISQSWGAEVLRVRLASQSEIKKTAVRNAFHFIFPEREIQIVTSASNSGVAEQPVGRLSGEEGAHHRLESLIDSQEPTDYSISIENYITERNSNEWIDQAVVVMQKAGSGRIIEYSAETPFSAEFAQQAKDQTPANYPLRASGFATTAGKRIHAALARQGIQVDADNWQGHSSFGGQSRESLITPAIIRAVIKSELVTVANFPKPGILFRDMTPLMGNPEIFQAVIRLFAEKVQGLKIDAVAGLDARGFLLGAPLALLLKKPFLPVRKKGKLPAPTHSQRYTTEYSVDEIEISAPDLKGKNILIVDDLLATGGTLKASENLFFQAGAEHIYSTCLIELIELQGRRQLKAPFFALTHY